MRDSLPGPPDRRGLSTQPVAGARPVVILVCGESERGDDGAAIAAVESLPAGIRALARIEVVGALDVEHLLGVPAGAACVVVDAAVGVPPGQVATGTLASLAGRAGAGPRPGSSHVLPVADVLGLAATLRGELPPGGFVGLGATSFGLGEGLTPAVERALPAYVAAIVAEIERLALAQEGEPT